MAKKKEEKTYSGITTKKLKNGETAIMVRFKYLGKTYPLKNFTKLFNCRTEYQAFITLNEEVKKQLTDGKDPFNSQTKNLDYYFDERYKIQIIKKEWREDTTAKNYLKFYNKYMRKSLGWKKLSKITYTDLDDILKSISHTGATQHNQLKKILNPIFKEAMRRGEVDTNPASLLQRHKENKKEKISKRTTEDNLIIVRKLYKGIGLYKPKETLKNELNAYLYLLLLTAHRYGELLKLTREDIYLEKNLIISPAEITKTREDYHYPIPEECLEYFKSVKSGKLFPNLRYSSVADYWSKLMSLSEIEFFNGKTLTPHDTRSLMLHVMMRNCKIDSRLADFCLEHYQGEVISHYLDFTYEDKREAFFD
ncbi:tyrosine-type recombinase/integrase, partial [Sulfurimonas sp. SAG-AH-194-L11]